MVGITMCYKNSAKLFRTSHDCEGSGGFVFSFANGEKTEIVNSCLYPYQLTKGINTANKRIDKALNQGLITKNKASRLKSRLTKKVNESK